MMELTSPAKINLFLDVTARRSNGYHEIATVFLPVENLCDKVVLTELDEDGVEIVCEHPSVPCDERNLCHKAAVLFAEEAKVVARWKILIEKNIPVAGGMGGGSSDAAAVLRLLNQKYSNKVTAERLAEIALEIGADVPYFLDPVAAKAEGLGEELLSIKAPKLQLLLITFDFPIAAAWAYQNRDQVYNRAERSLFEVEACLEAGDLKGIAGCVYNDLAIACREKFPVLKMACDDLLKVGALASEVSGSGPTVFGLFESSEAAEEAKVELLESKLYAEEALKVCSTIGS